MTRVQVSLALLSVHELFFAFGTFVQQLLAMDTFDVFFEVFVHIGVTFVTVRTL